jgi:hypothetical protein
MGSTSRPAGPDDAHGDNVTDIGDLFFLSERHRRDFLSLREIVRNDLEDLMVI